MARYDFKCTKCNSVVELFIPMNVVISNPDWNKKTCAVCQSDMEQYFGLDDLTIVSERDRIKMEVLPAHAEDWKRKQNAKRQEAIMAEGWANNNELKEAHEIAREEEKKRGKTPGTFAGGVKAPANKEEVEKLKADSIKKKDEAQRLRKKTL